LFPRKLKSKWFGPFVINSGAIELENLFLKEVG